MEKIKFRAFLVAVFVISLTPVRAQWTVGSSIDYRGNINESPVQSVFIIPKVGYRYKAVEVFMNTSLPYFAERHDLPNWTAGLGANISIYKAQLPKPFAADSSTFPLEIFGSVQYNFGHPYVDRDDYLTSKYDENGTFTHWERQSYEFTRIGNFTQVGLGVRAKMGKLSPFLLLGIGSSPDLRVVYRVDELQNTGIELNTFEANYVETPVNIQVAFGIDVDLALQNAKN